MLKPAKLYENELKLLFAEIMFDEAFMYADVNSYRDELKLVDSTWTKHQFASVNEKGEVVGWFSYSINRDSGAAYALQIVNFKKDVLCPTFGKDLKTLFEELFLKFKFYKLNFSVVIGNPAEAFYDKYIEQIGGRILGYYEKDVKLIDGQYYDLKMYEVMRENFIARQRP